MVSGSPGQHILSVNHVLVEIVFPLRGTSLLHRRALRIALTNLTVPLLKGIEKSQFRTFFQTCAILAVQEPSFLCSFFFNRSHLNGSRALTDRIC